MNEYATVLIEPLSESNIRLALTYLLDKIKNKSPIGKYKDADIFLLGDNGVGYLVLIADNEVIYFVRYRKIRHNSLPLGRQVLLWRDRSDPRSAGFAKQAFFNILIPKYKALISDVEQTSLGQGFWSTSIEYALRSNYYVYFLNRRSTPNTLIPLLTEQDVIKYKKDIWGYTQGHKYTYAVISSIPLRLKKEN